MIKKSNNLMILLHGDGMNLMGYGEDEAVITITSRWVNCGVLMENDCPIKIIL